MNSSLIENIKTLDFNIDVSTYQNEFSDLDWKYLNKMQRENNNKLMHLPSGFDKAIVLKWLNKKTDLYNMFYDKEFFKPIFEKLFFDEKTHA